MAKVSKKVKEKVNKLPDSPGVYKFLDSGGKILYVGKARRLKKRVSTYFRPGRARDNRLEMLVSQVRDIKIIRASSEAEALIYEAGLIKDHRPKFNIDLKDDKSYPFLKLTLGEKYPRLFLTRRKVSDGAVYYGPYVNVKLLKEALSFMKKVFPLRTCRRMLKAVCLEYHLEQCVGPCEGKVTKKEYEEVVEQLKKFLEGRKDDLIRGLKGKMKDFSEKKEYEKALSVKKRIEALTAIQQLHDRAQHPIYGELDELKNALDLKKIPMVIECFDVSNIGGHQAVGSMVRFAAGKARKSDYRKFRIRKVCGIDDYSMIKELLRRRYSRLVTEDKTLPDLVIIDGGKGHLSVARKALHEVGLPDLPVVAIAKEYNHLYTASRKNPIRLSPGSRLLLLIQRIRDEAHRFAITYHRSLRRKETFETDLKGIKGVGPVKEKLLIKRLGSPGAVRKASLETLKNAGMNEKTAREIVEHFKDKD